MTNRYCGVLAEDDDCRRAGCSGGLGILGGWICFSDKIDDFVKQDNVWIPY